MDSSGLRGMVTNVSLRIRIESSTILGNPRSVMMGEFMFYVRNVFNDTGFAFGHIILSVIGFRKYRERMAIVLSVHDNRRGVQKFTATSRGVQNAAERRHDH